jgi:hypothetical protein
MPKWAVIPLPVDNATAGRLAERLALDIVSEARARRGRGATPCTGVGDRMQTRSMLDPRSLGKADSALGG